MAGSRVLVVNDRPEDMASAAGVLRSLGMTVMVATSTEDALERLGTPAVDIVVSDMARGDDPAAGRNLIVAMRAAAGVRDNQPGGRTLEPGS